MGMITELFRYLGNNIIRKWLCVNRIAIAVLSDVYKLDNYLIVERLI